MGANVEHSLREAIMKNQITSLQSILFILLVVLGINAFTNPAQDDEIYSEITEGKVQAAEKNYKDSLTPQYLRAQQDFKKMNIDFDSLATKIENDFGTLPQLSVGAQPSPTQRDPQRLRRCSAERS